MVSVPIGVALLAGPGCRSSRPVDSGDGFALAGEPWRWAEAAALGGHPTAGCRRGDGTLVVAVDGALWTSPDDRSWLVADAAGLPAGRVDFLGCFAGDPPVTLAWVDGEGLFRSEGAGWSPVPTPPESAWLRTLNPRAAAVPFDLAVDPHAPERGWLAALGGLFTTEDAGQTWAPVEGLGEAGFNLLFTGVAAHGPLVVATAFRPAGLLPASAADQFTSSVFVSEDGGASWRAGDPEGQLRYPSAVALDPGGRAWIATQDSGLWLLDDAGLQAWGGPTDAVGLEWSRGGLNLASASRGAWRLQESGWSALGEGPVAVLVDDHALGWDGRHWALEPGLGAPPGSEGGATVHVALSMHVNLYHSYRGDTNDDDGYGIDLEVMRGTLDWLDAHPQVRADWDFDNAWSTDGPWMQVDGADVLARIQARVAAGTDDVRLMSWNNGAMVAHDRAEFDEVLARTWASNRALFPRVVAGVQPQENMFTPEHVAWYADAGVDWVTLAFSGTPFTALRGELDLPEDAWYAPSTVQWDGRALTLVPTYHHGDLLDHGGLRGWVEQLHGARAGDALLVLHLDADAETWQTFDRELDAVADLPWVQFTTIQDHLDTHAPQVEVPHPYDVADGTGDGFQSWAEKQFNHEIATGIVQARERASQARALAPEDGKLAQVLAAALPPRLLALSTTHFGLAAPWLHPDRQASARAFTAEALEAATAARDLAEALVPVAPGTLELVEHRGSAGTALVEVRLAIPAAAWVGDEALWLRDEAGEELPFALLGVEEGDDAVAVDLRLALAIEAGARRVLSWGLDPTHTPRLGAVDPATLATGVGPEVAFTECEGRQDSVGPRTATHPELDPRQVQAQLTEEWELPLCGELGRLRHTTQRLDGLPGTLLEVQADLPVLDLDRVDLAESVALSPVACPGHAAALAWRSLGGRVHERPIRPGVRSWNGQAVDGWVALRCADGSTVQVAHRAVERSSMAPAPLRDLGSRTLLAPLGTLWGGAPRHDVRQTGGHGMGDLVTGVVGSQFRPSAPDWAGQVVRYRLLLGAGEIDEGTLDLFAHPPWVRVGGWPDSEQR